MLLLISAILLVNLFILIMLIRLCHSIKTQQKFLKQQIYLLENSQVLQLQKNDQLIDERRSYVFLQALQLRDAIAKQVSNLHPRAIEDAPFSHGLTAKELSESFSPMQLEAIASIWDLFHQYVDTYWRTEQGKIKTVFKGAVDLKGSEVHTILNASNQLIPKIDHLLKQMKGVEH
ncbi:hypothetical protein [Alkalihalobacillus sp. BA299]|uniref:hypothetical protein n=1 Tax=Alkalihalobacillus sp. BA299 TaxID=2815938 RepID=UPI001ADAE1CF|nr:hypothetical protein [Alkalihalobacillus sp. BA299]